MELLSSLQQLRVEPSSLMPTLLRGEKYTTYVNTSPGSVVMEFADKSAADHPFGATLTAPIKICVDLAAHLPLRARMVVKLHPRCFRQTPEERARSRSRSCRDDRESDRCPGQLEVPTCLAREPAGRGHRDSGLWHRYQRPLLAQPSSIVKLATTVASLLSLLSCNFRQPVSSAGERCSSNSLRAYSYSLLLRRDGGIRPFSGCSFSIGSDSAAARRQPTTTAVRLSPVRPEPGRPRNWHRHP